MGEMVLGGCGYFISAGIFGLHTLSLLLTSLVAHDRATEDNHTYIQERNTSPPIQEALDNIFVINVGTVHKPGQGGINSVPL